MKTKTLLSSILILCILLLAVPFTALGATEITEVVLTGDITPVANGSCKYLSIPSGANYTVKQYGGKDIHYWGDLESESMITSFASTGVYGYILALTPKDGYEFAEDVKVTLNGKVLTENVDYSVFADEDDVVGIQIMRGYALDGGSHMHEADMNSYGAIDEDYHGYRCSTPDCPYIFNVENFKYKHYFEGGVCTDCGYKTTYTLPVITKQPQNVTKTCNKSVTLSIEASGEGLKYLWYYEVEGKDPVCLGGGAQLTTESNLLYQDSVQYYCKVYNRAGEVYSDKATITVSHSGYDYQEAYEYGETSSGSDTIYYGATHHSVRCTGCGKFLGYERHTYVDYTCKYCDHIMGTSKAPLPEIKLSAPNYYYGAYTPFVVSYSEGAMIDSYQWQIRKKGETKWVNSSYFQVTKGYEYRLEITLKSLPASDFEIKYPWPKVTIGGRECKPYFTVGSNEFTVELPEPMSALNFDPNGGEGSMSRLKSVDGQFILPECTYTKSGDSFVAWRVDGKLYGVGEQVNVSDTSTAYAVWESERIIAAEVTMSKLYECKTPADVKYTTDKDSFSVESVSWCEGDTYTAANAMNETDKFDMSKNYIAKITLNGFFAAEGVDFWVNNQQMTDMVRVSSSRMIVYVRVINNAEIFFEPPEDGITLPKKSEFQPASESYRVSLIGWCPTNEYDISERFSEDTVAQEGTTYYLRIPVKTEENYIFGGNKLKINGKECEVYDNTGVTLNVRTPFTATAPRFRVYKKSNVDFTVTAPEAKEVCFIAAFYDTNGRLKKTFINDGYSLEAGENSLTFVQMFGITSSRQLSLFKNAFNTAAYATVMMWDGLDSMEPLSYLCKYK
ncbi:MAG: immunoglobulin domain-containing protein [Clostridia bacterium]|nr:immunoglobulin domain-containing protein [Clostridia bacterium]